MSHAKPDASILRALYAQIEDVCKHFNEIRTEAQGIAQTGQVPDATLHLNDVLQSTEEATTTILDAATAISGIADSSAMSAEEKAQISEQVSQIYAACGFQDISGQRIKKVLIHLSTLESQLAHLSNIAKGQQAAPKTADSLLNGPQLTSTAPSQIDIDKLFNTL